MRVIGVDERFEERPNSQEVLEYIYIKVRAYTANPYEKRKMQMKIWVDVTTS